MATKVIGGTLKLSGESEFNRAVSSCSKSLKEMQSAMKLVQAQTAGQANSYDSLKQKQEALTKVLDAQKSKQQELKRALDSAKSDNAEVGAAVDRLRERYAQEKAELDRLKSSEDATNDEIEEQEKLVSGLEKALYKQTQEYQKSENRVKDWQTKLNSADAEIVKTNQSLDANSRLMEEADASTDKCAHSIDEFGNTVKRASTETQQMQIALQKQLVADTVLRNLEKAAAAVKRLASEISIVTTAYENGAAKVATIADSETVPLAQLKESMLSLSTETGKGIDEITEATYQAISASVDTADAVSFVKDATNLAKAGFLETADSVDVLTTIINSYKMSASDAESISDKLVQTQNRGKTTVNELSQSMGQVIPLAAAYNVNLDNLSTSYIELTKNGIATSEAGTMLKGMFSELAKDGTKVAGILKDKTGKSFGELMKEGSSLGDVLDILYESVKGNSEAFANLWSNVRARTGALSLAQTGAAAFNRELTAVANSAGNVSSALEKLDTPSAKANKAMNALKNAGALLGDSFMSAAAPAMEAAAKATQDLTKWVDDLPPSIKTVVGVGGGAIALLATATPKIIAFRNTIQSFKAIKTATDTIKVLKAKMEGTAKTAEEVASAAKTGSTALKTVGSVAGPVAAAFGAVAVALIAANKAFMDAAAACNPYHDALLDIEEQNKTLQESIETTRSAFSKSFDGAEADTLMASNLMSQLEELMAAEEKDAAAKEKIKTIVAELNETIPSLGLAYDEVTDSLNLSNEEVERSIRLAEQQAKAAAYQEVYTETLKKQAEAELNYSRAQDTVRSMTEGLTDAQRDMYAEMVRNGENLYMQAGLSSALADQYGNAWTATEEVRRSLKDLNDAQDIYNDVLEDSEYYGGKWTDILSELGDQTEKTAEKNDELSASAQIAAAELDESAESIESSYADMYDAAYESIESQIGLFDEMSTAYEESAEEMSRALETQQEALALYDENLDAAKGYIASLTDDAKENAGRFLESIASMGIDGAGYLNAFVEAIKANDGTAEQLLANFANAEQAKANYAKSMSDMQAATEQMTQSTQAEVEAGTEATAKTVLGFKGQFANAGQQLGEAQAQGVSSASTASQEAARQNINAAGNVFASTPAYSWGADMGSQFASGIRDKAGEVASAASAVASAAHDYLGHSTPKKGELHGDDKWGDELVSNIAKGMNRKTGEVTKAAKRLAKLLTKEIKSLKLNNYQTAVYTQTVEDRIDSMTKVNTLTLAEEEAFWKQVVKRAKKGTAEYKTALKAFKATKKELNTEVKTLTKDLISDVKSVNKDLKEQIAEVKADFKDEKAEISADLKKERAEIKANLAEDIKDIKEAYAEAVKTRQQSITGSLDLFDKSSTKLAAAYSKESYMRILKMQVENLDAWQKTLESLSGKIKNQGLLEELQSLGVEQLKVLGRFDKMTAEELAEYEALYEKRDEIAKKQATAEHESVFAEAEAQIEELKAAADAQIAELEAAADAEIAALRAARDKEIETLTKAADKEIAALQKQYLEDLKELGMTSKTSGTTVGKQIAAGISAGFKAGMKNVKKDTKAELKDLLAAIKKDLKIKSPSKVYEDEIGENTAAGIGVGFVEKMKSVVPDMEKAIPKKLDAVMEVDSSMIAPESASDSRQVVVESHIYLGKKEITELLTKEVIQKITTDQTNKRIAKGAVAYV